MTRIILLSFIAALVLTLGAMHWVCWQAGGLPKTRKDWLFLVRNGGWLFLVMWVGLAVIWFFDEGD